MWPILLHALIDSGASHSFVYASLIKKLDRTLKVMNNVYSIFLPSGKNVLSQFWFRDVPIIIIRCQLIIDLLVLEMQDYDIILNIDRQTKYNATIVCKKNNVIFQPTKGDVFEFKSTSKEKRLPMISAMEARKMLAD